MATSEPVLAPFTSQDFNDCEAVKNFIIDFAYRCGVKRVDPLAKMVLTALGFATNKTYRPDPKKTAMMALEKLPSLTSHVLKTNTREYDIPQRTTRQYEVTLGAQVNQNLAPGPQTEVWTLDTTVDPSATYNDAYFVRDYAVGYLYLSTDPVNVVQEMVLIVARNTGAGTITVIRNHDNAGRPMPLWANGTKIYLGENAIPEVLPDCEISCEAILAPCCDVGYIQGFKHCQSVTKEWINRPVYAPFSNKSQEAYRQMLDNMIEELTNTLFGSFPSKFVDTAGSINYTMAGQAYWRSYYTQLNVDDCCFANFDEAILSLAENSASPDFTNTNIYIGLASKQVMRYLRDQFRLNTQIFKPASDYQGIKPEVWEIAKTLGTEQPLVYASDGIYVIFVESPAMTLRYPFQVDLINYGTYFLTTVPEMNVEFQGVNSKYGGFMRRIDPNLKANIESSFCPLEVGYEGMLGHEQFCAAANASLRLVNCDSCSGEIVLGPTDEFPDIAPEDSGAVDLPDGQ